MDILIGIDLRRIRDPILNDITTWNVFFHSKVCFITLEKIVNCEYIEIIIL